MSITVEDITHEARERTRWVTTAQSLAKVRTTDRDAYIAGLRELVDSGCPQALIARVLDMSPQTLNYQVLRAAPRAS